MADYVVMLLLSAAALVVGIVAHESAHALAAYALGDATARSRGRISLNPLNHLDPFGTVVLPLIMIALGGPVFAFAKPVPVYLGNLKNPKRDEVIVALAGPAANILLAIASAACMALVAAALSFAEIPYPVGAYIVTFLMTMVYTNLSLAFFNLIPLPPLDGSSIVVPFLHGEAQRSYYRLQHYAMPILIIVLYLLPRILHIDLIGWYFDVTVYPLADALLSWASSF